MKPILSFANYSSSTFQYLLIYLVSLACLGWLNQVIDYWCVYMVNDERPPFFLPPSLPPPSPPSPPFPPFLQLTTHLSLEQSRKEMFAGVMTYTPLPSSDTAIWLPSSTSIPKLSLMLRNFTLAGSPPSRFKAKYKAESASSHNPSSPPTQP